MLAAVACGREAGLGLGADCSGGRRAWGGVCHCSSSVEPIGRTVSGDPVPPAPIAGFDRIGARWCVGAAPTATIGPAYCRRLRYDSLAGDLPAGPAALHD